MPTRWIIYWIALALLFGLSFAARQRHKVEWSAWPPVEYVEPTLLERSMP